MEEVHKHLFRFEDIVRLENKTLQGLLLGIDRGKLALALKDAPRAIWEKISSNVTRRVAESLRDEVRRLGPVKFSEVEAAREEILMTILNLESAGGLFVSGRRSDGDRMVR